MLAATERGRGRGRGSGRLISEYLRGDGSARGRGGGSRELGQDGNTASGGDVDAALAVVTNAVVDAGRGGSEHGRSTRGRGRGRGRGDAGGAPIIPLPPVIPFIDTAATRAMASFGVTFAPITGPNATGATSGPVASAGGKSKTANFSSWSGEDEHRVIKSLVFCDEQENPFIVLMHGDYYVQNRSVALAVGVRRAGPCAPEVAEKHTGMQTGGISPFGVARPMPVYMEQTLMELDYVFISGGMRGYIVRTTPQQIVEALRPTLVRVGVKKRTFGEEDDEEKGEIGDMVSVLSDLALNFASVSSLQGDVSAVSSSQTEAAAQLAAEVAALDSGALAVVYELRQAQFDEVTALEAIFCEGEFVLNSELATLDASLEAVTEGGTAGEIAMRDVYCFPPITFELALKIADNRGLNTQQQLVCAVKAHFCLPRRYPEEGCIPLVSLERVLVTDTAVELRRDQVVKTVLDIDEVALLIALRSEATRLLPDPCTFELSQWLTEHLFGFALGAPGARPKDAPKEDPAGKGEGVASLDKGQAGVEAEGELYRTVVVGGDPDHLLITTKVWGELELFLGKGEPTLLGKPKTHIKLGLVGLPNVGKSSLFNLLSGLRVPAENYPFCTIDPNVATVAVPDPRFDRLCALTGGREEQHKPPIIQITDIAGLVEGACKGEGLGNAFLHHVSVCHVLFHVVRGFADLSIEHVKGNVDPVRDMAIIATELRLKDLQAMEKRIAEYDRPRPFQDLQFLKQRKEELTMLLKAREYLLRGWALRHVPWTAAEAHFLGRLQMWTSKPAVYLLNVSHDDYMNHSNPHIPAVRQWLALHSPESPVVPLSVQFEEEANKARDKEGETNESIKLVAPTLLACTPDLVAPHALAETEAEEVVRDDDKEDLEATVGSASGIGDSAALTEMVQCGYRGVHLIHFFTVSERDGVAAWMLRQGTKAQDAAKKMHYDLDKLFVACETHNEVYAFVDLVGLGSVANVKAAGKYRTVGKDYEVQDGDIIRFKFMPRSTLKKR